MADPLRHPEDTQALPADDQQGPERQRFTRRSILLNATLRDDEGAVDCDLVDISAGGAKVHVAAPFRLGAQLLLTIGDEHTFYSKVAWRDGEFLGLRFIEPPESIAAAIPDILRQNKEGAERRSRVRSTVLWSAEIYGGLRRAKCEILNISSSGAKLHTAGNFAPGTEVAIRSVRFGEFRAEVIWQDKESGTLGVHFLEEDERIAEVIRRSLPSIRKDDD